MTILFNASKKLWKNKAFLDQMELDLDFPFSFIHNSPQKKKKNLDIW